MHEASLANAVAAALRQHPGDCGGVRVYLRDLDSTPDQLARSIETHLAASQAGARPPRVEVVLVPVERICASCAARWSDAQPDPSCPSCGGVPLPRPHDHWMEVELVP